MEKVAEVVDLVIDASGVEDKDKRKAGVGIMLETYIKDIMTINIELGLQVYWLNFVITVETTIISILLRILGTG